ncbi:hypothetical protein LOTGIDRAFT_164931 [Lottia gigantea]|uniref:Uncharacterized protein n=1 Tax=Lottia gigantea TaxID=225164 RepID=V3ZEQ3_LOTGI|nr:hypothetical protein LOTGIDRAFT_164931 [Lottia gigantea]ESO89628.1 hypothetical protein LOTGIDRAFT_164931 [Lottia gigantea]
MALLCLRATPIDHHLPSPAELLNKRKYRTNLPIANTNTQDRMITERLMERQETQKKYHDRNVKPLRPLTSGQYVNVQNPKTLKWGPAVGDRSYKVELPNGHTVRRNRTFLKERGRKVKFEIPEEPDPILPQTNSPNQSPTSTPTTEQIEDPGKNNHSEIEPGIQTRSGRIRTIENFGHFGMIKKLLSSPGRNTYILDTTSYSRWRTA